MQRTVFIVALTTLIPISAYARAMPIFPGGGCAQENATLGVNFNFKAQSFAEAKQKFDDEMKQFDDFAKQQHIEKLIVQNMNYSVNSQQAYGNMSDGSYQLNGNASYRMESADDAFKLGDFLTKQHFMVNVNVNRNGNGPCPIDNASPPPPPPPPAAGIEHPR